MEYITEIHALNLPCALETCGDWHCSAIQWKQPHIRDSKNSLFGEYGIEADRKVPNHEGIYRVANHIRALLDLLEAGKYSIAQGMRYDFIDNEKYNAEIFDLVSQMQGLENWPDIDSFMEKEYMMKWRKYKEQKGL